MLRPKTVAAVRLYGFFTGDAAGLLALGAGGAAAMGGAADGIAAGAGLTATGGFTTVAVTVLVVSLPPLSNLSCWV
ncbi:MAG TPA: hypothetical protein VK581_11445, partial [Chthoniobacterales bacterium]|nr:hypothetical protein [Chthoniobacterales bacterium]